MKLLYYIIFVVLFPVYIYAINFTTIDNLNNPANRQGYGRVDYIYNIGTYEITNSQYCLFLNCVASKGDPHKLYSPLMTQHFLGGIIRIRTSQGYVYRCKEGYQNKPVIGVTWMSAVRYINWLHYNSENIEFNRPVNLWNTCTEGDENNGAYNTTKIPLKRNAGAIYWLPNRSEWEKAAYYTGTEWIYNNYSDKINCFSVVYGWYIPYPHIADVGFSKGPNGTFDQQGNAAEWIENSQGEWKLALGGSLIRPIRFSYCGELEGDDANKSISTFGFRVCQLSDSISRKKHINPYYSNDRVNKHCVEKRFVTDVQGAEYVAVLDAGNVGDPVNQYKGAVPYNFYISKTELSNAQYCAFLNAVATKSDPYNLYKINMGNGVCGGIIRLRHNGNFQYKCRLGWEKRPIVYIEYCDLARYANWMHYGCPFTGESVLGTTEGNSILGAYDTSDFELVKSGKKKVYKTFGRRNKGAKFWIPNEDEWYKAAYYDPTIIGNRKYYDYPTRSSNPPTREQSNYVINDSLTVGEPFFVAEVDSFSNSPSYYGTLQQGGNVWEWIESWQYGVVGIRGLRGGSWSYTAFGLNACNTDPGGLNDYSYVFGARLCMSYYSEGWSFVDRSFSFQDIYEYVMLLPKSRIILLVIYVLTVSVLTVFMLIIFIKNKICKQK